MNRINTIYSLLKKVFVDVICHPHAMLRMSALLLFFIPFSSYALLDNHTAASAYKKGDFKSAQDIYKKPLIDEPDNGQLLFNLGDSAYRLQEYQQARAYFSQAADLLTKNRELQEQAYYNAGNAYFKEEKLQESLELYNKVLELNPENEKALHNKKVVEELLKQKEQQQDQKDQNKNQNKDKQDQKKQDQQNSQDNKDNKDQNKDKQDQQKQDQKN